MKEANWRLSKRPTGIPGLDWLTQGGLPRGQAALVLGEAGTGKTVLSLQIMSNAVIQGGGGVFVSFEESREQLLRNADSFGWGDTLISSKAWSVIDARSSLDMDISGSFDMGGLLAAIDSQIKDRDDPWIVIDGIDQLLQRQPDPRSALEQVRQINDYCEQRRWTLLLSGKVGESALAPLHLAGIEYMLPTMILLTASVIERRLHRFVRVAKYRGSAHIADQVSMLLTHEGIQLPYFPIASEAQSAVVDNRRVSTGVPRVDEVMGGGVYRGSSLLISGQPGTAKSTLAASLAQSVAQSGEKVLIISFDETEGPYVRNLSSVGIALQPHIDAGRIRFYSGSATGTLIGEQLLGIAKVVETFDPQCVVIDPVCALFNAPGGGEDHRAAIEWVHQLTRFLGITTVMTALVDRSDPAGQATLGHISAIADAWIKLDYNERDGERNRSLSVVKSRGTAHSNQLRELLLSSDGIDLADVYDLGAEVLMGTARILKEREAEAARQLEKVEREQRRTDLQLRIEQARDEVRRLDAELEMQERKERKAQEYDLGLVEDIRESRQPDYTSPEPEQAQGKGQLKHGQE